MSRINDSHIGWWCDKCSRAHRVDVESIDCERGIPVFRPLDVPEPVDVDEVETMVAEVLTWHAEDGWLVLTPVVHPDEDQWAATTHFSYPAGADCSAWINEVARASATLRTRRGIP